MRRVPILGSFAVLFCGLWTPSYAAQESLEGHWEGALVREGDELKIMVDFKTESGLLKGTIDSPDVGALGIPLIKISSDSPKVHFELPPAAQGLIFDGELAGDKISGSLKPGEMAATFYLKRQTAKPLLYNQEEVRFTSGEVTLAGTLILPAAKGPHPAVIFAPSSGPATRDSSRFLAELFARHGVAALIYDKRGAGASTGDWWQASFDDLAQDALAGVQFLTSRNDINSRQIGLRGQSQGARISAIAASRSDGVAFVILVAAGSLNPEQQELRRVEYEIRQDGFPEDEIAEAVTLMKLKFHFARTGEEWKKYKAAAGKAKDEKWFSYVEAPLSKNDPSFGFWRLINDYDPVQAWEKVTCPLLSILGEFDTNTPVPETAALMRKSLEKAGNKDVTVEVFPNAEHTLFTRPDASDSWKWPRFANGYLDTQINWLLKRVDVVK